MGFTRKVFKTFLNNSKQSSNDDIIVARKQYGRKNNLFRKWFVRHFPMTLIFISTYTIYEFKYFAF